MKSLNSFINLINKLSSEELKSLMKYLKYYNSKSLGKGVNLIDLIVNQKEYNSVTIQKKLYGKENLFAFNKLIDRLKSKTLEVLIFDSNIKNDIYNNRIKIIFELKKKLIQCDILSYKGLRDDGDNLCKKIISKAEKYELYDIVSNALVIRQRFVNIRKKSNEIKAIENYIEYANNKNKSIVNAQIIYGSVANKISNSSGHESYFNELISSISILENEYDKYKSNIVCYYLYLLKTEFHQIKEEYVVAGDYLNKLQDLLNNISIYNETRMGSVLLNVANNCIHLRNYEDAIKFAVKSKPYFPNNILNQALVDENLFFSYFYKGKFDESLKLMTKLVKLPVANSVSFYKYKWNYYLAVILFVLGQFEKCIEILSNMDEINRDKEGWNINRRLLLIMARIETKNYESVDSQVDNLEKFIKRGIKKRDISMRYVYIIRILIKLINSNYQFNSVIETRKKYFELIQSNEDSVKWKIKSPELVPFHSWYEIKWNTKILLNDKLKLDMA